jgi:very-short-patch-repair endonuclease/DNA polymerase III delta prime subunit
LGGFNAKAQSRRDAKKAEIRDQDCAHAEQVRFLKNDLLVVELNFGVSFHGFSKTLIMAGKNNVVIQRYLERLLRSVRRSGLLNAYPTSSIKRLDLTRLRVADSGLPDDVLTKLIKSDEGRVQFELDLSERELAAENQKESPEEALYYALTRGLARTAEAFKRETGVRSLWLAYPLFYVRFTDNNGEPKYILSPIFLWPIKIESPLQTQGRVVISRDKESGGPKYNKALDVWIAENLNFNPDDPSRDDFDEITRSELEEVVRKLYAGLKPAPSVSLIDPPQQIPDKQSLGRLPTPCVLNSAVIGLIQWENQALTHDLENLLKIGKSTELLDDYLSGKGREAKNTTSIPPEHDRFHVTDADPSQERAVWLARSNAGLVVHGPPGTGKSQTIVNMVADALAHGQRVMVVCQKRAAIDVVAARLKAQGLDDLFCVIHDSESDRTQTILGIKAQIASTNLRDVGNSVSAQRLRLSSEIEKLEAQLSEFTEAICGVGRFGLAYRDLLAKAAKLYIESGRIQPNEKLKQLFAEKTLADLAEIESEIASTGEIWAQARPKNNPWRFRCNDFAIDPVVKDSLDCDLKAIALVDNEHSQFVAERGRGFAITGNPIDFVKSGSQWLSQIKSALEPAFFESCCAWLNKASKHGRSVVDQTVSEIQPILDRFASISRENCETSYTQEFRLMDTAQANERLNNTAALIELETKWWRYFSPRFHSLHKRLKLSLCRPNNVLPDELKRLREFWLLWLDCQHWALCFASELLSEAENNPWFKEVVNHFAHSDPAALASDMQHLLLTIERAPLAANVTNELGRLKSRFADDYLAKLVSIVGGGGSVALDLKGIQDGFAGLESLQMLDLNRPYRGIFVGDVLSVLEEAEPETSPSANTDARWWAIVQISAFICWKEVCETNRPVLRRTNVAQFEQNRLRLGKAIEEKRSLEVEFIHELWHERQSGRRKGDFNGILVTRGPNSKRLRQVVELGDAIGLFDFRPCWLTNPNTASQIFPLTEHFFDMVIFDEASQCPIEQAVPAIYRAKRLVVAGDEKQLPPTAFFQSNFSFGDEPPEESEENVSVEIDLKKELAKAGLDQALAVTDLLEASKPLLRQSLLNIHYRSEHPALISFSNHAFYSGQLQIPPSMQTSPAEAPLLLIEAKGIYDKKKNVIEAQKVIELLRQIWLASSNPPTIGIVTFNEVQRDLIEDMLLDEAAKDPQFQVRYIAERNRVEHEQDVGFFVKNLESVQGDERDVIIFSTTFGRDPQGQFRRFFGPINQLGGERRLNVAVTRAKKRNFVVTSMPLHEISDVLASGGAPVGAKIGGRDYLHAYMQYVKAVSIQDGDAQRHTLAVAGRLAATAGASQAACKEESLFEAEVRDALTALGYTTEAQVGESGFRIDLAVVNPIPELGFILGIECDGKAYHSEWTARARDVWRQQILERRGWKIHRIWSTNWWLDRDSEIRKLVARIKSLIGS